ncbi:MAG: D-glycero-alpha-D-manno-heptose-1,7-bisphosphate 7-phosphatase [Candidatus Baltobacteraceae bacterium]
MEPPIDKKPRAVLFDRDGTLVIDVPYNGDPKQVVLVPGAEEALDALRAAGLKVGVISNQSGVARGMITIDQVESVNRRIEELCGPFHVWLYCPHGPADGCECRKPLPGMVLEAARLLDIDPADCIVVGDKQSDMEAADAAGALGILFDHGTTHLPDIAHDVLNGF